MSAATSFNQNNKLLWSSAGGAVLAVVFLFGIPARRRKWQTMLGMVMLLLSICGVAAGCGGQAAKGNSGTTPGSYTVTVTGTSGTTTATGIVSLTVQ
jgi:hypothetical protein